MVSTPDSENYKALELLETVLRSVPVQTADSLPVELRLDFQRALVERGSDEDGSEALLNWIIAHAV